MILASGPPTSTWQEHASKTIFDFPVGQKSLPDELTKPFFVKTITWTAPSALDTVLDSFALPTGALQVNPNTMVLNNYQFMRPSFRLFFKVSGTPFHQGKIMIGFIPLEWPGTWTSSKSSILSNLTSTTMSTKNHIVIDASVAGVYTLDVPYEHFVERFCITADRNVTGYDSYYRGLGAVVAMPVVALNYAVGSTTSIPINVFCQYVDTHVSVMRKSAAPSNGVWQSGEILSALSDMAITTATGVLKDKISKMSNRDNPIAQKSTELTTRFDLLKVMGPSTSKTIGPLPMLIQPTPEQVGGIGGYDGSILDLLMKPAWYKSLSWTAGLSVGSSLLQAAVFPGQFQNATTIASGIYQNHVTPLAYFSRLFTYWRGGINIKLEVASTNFHRGKLLVALTPITLNNPTTITEATNYPHFILDIQERKSFTMKVPYDELHPYRKNNGFDSTADACCYVINVFVLNTLATTTAMAAVVDVIVYVSAAEDFEFAIQNTNNLIEVAAGTVWFAGKVSATPNLLAEQHSGETLVDESEPITIDSEPAKAVLVVEDKQVVGGPFGTLEMQLSNMVKRPFLLCSTIGYDLAATTSFVRVLTFPVTPTPMSGVRSLVGNTRYTPLVGITNFLPAVASLYRFWRGSMKYRLVFTTSKTDRVIIYAIWTPTLPYGLGLAGTASNRAANPWTYSEPTSGNSVSRTTFTRYVGNMPAVIQDLSTDPVVQFTVPYMAATNRLLTSGIPPPSGATKNDIAFYDKNYYNGFISIYAKCDGGQVVNSTNQASISCGVWVSGGDDFELSTYMGIPIISVYTGFDSDSYTWVSKEQFDGL